MRNYLKPFAVLSACIFLLMPVPANTAGTMTFEAGKPSFGLYCEDESAVDYGTVRFVIGEDGNAAEFSEYSVKSGTFYVPFIASELNIPVIDTVFEAELYYGSALSLRNDYKYDFYSPDLNAMTGTVYTLNATDETFTVDFTMLENQTCICRFPPGFRMIRDSKHIESTISGAQTDISYEVLILNGDCAAFESSAQVSKETVTVKDYIDCIFNDFKDFFTVGNLVPKPDLFYALANQAVANNVNYDFFDFFIDSFSMLRLNAYKIEIQAPCTLTYSMSVEVLKNVGFDPAIYKTDRIATGSYSVGYTVELNDGLPFVIESSADLQEQSGCVYTYCNVTDDFYFVFSASEKPKSIDGGNGGVEPWRIALLVIAGILACAFVISATLLLVPVIKDRKRRGGK